MKLHNHSPAADRNKQAIFNILQDYILPEQNIVEIGSGSGQHAIYFTERITSLMWQCTELENNLASLRENLARLNRATLAAPKELSVNNASHWQPLKGDHIFTANTLHIMPWQDVKCLFKHLPETLDSQGHFIAYGPFKYQQKFTSASNSEFDIWLKERNSLSGIRDFEQVNELAIESGLTFIEDYAMPANNQLLIWRKNV